MTVVETVVEARGLAVRSGRYLAVSDLDLTVRTGVTGLLGPNGAGKTTLLRALATLLLPVRGELTLFGRSVPCRDDARLRSLRRRIGYAPQANTVLGHLSVLEQVAYAAWLKGVSERPARRLAAAAVDRVDLASQSNTRTKRLSGGMLRRLTVAMAIVTEPDLILLDEPTAGLDPHQRVRFRELVAELGRDTAVVLSTHLIEDVVAGCDRIIVMQGGRNVFCGTEYDLAAVAGHDLRAGESAHEAAFLRLTETAGA